MTPANRNAWRGALTVGPGMAVYHGPASGAAEHRHDAVQLVAAPPGVDLRLTNDRNSVRGRGLIVGSRVRHAFEARAAAVDGRSPVGPGASGIVLVLVDPGTDLGRSLAPGGNGLDRMSDVSTGAILDAAVGGSSPDDRWHGVRTAVAMAVGEPAPSRTVAIGPDVVNAADIVRRSLPDVPSLGAVADVTGTPAELLGKRFQRQVGMPFRRFVLWHRLGRALAEVAAGHSLTRAAASAGFSDQSHFCRVVNSTFGVPPGALLAELELAVVDRVPADVRNVQAEVADRWFSGSIGTPADR